MEIADLVRGWTQGWEADGGAVKFADLFSEDAVYEDVPMGLLHEGRETIRGFHAAFMEVFVDQVYENYDFFTDGTNVCVSWTLSATQAQDLPDLPSLGKRFTVKGLTHFVVVDGEFTRCTDFWDRDTVWRQLS